MTNRQVKRALRTLHDFCYSHEKCDSCPFSELRDDLGFTCRVLDIVDDDRFVKAVSDVPDPTVTIQPGTIQYQPWDEFDDDL